VTPAWATTDLREPRIQTGNRDVPAADRGNERSVAANGETLGVAPCGARQPLTPPTVIPSMKKRCAKRNNTITGSTISVEAAMSRL
jgi:hypothetical protein